MTYDSTARVAPNKEQYPRAHYDELRHTWWIPCTITIRQVATGELSVHDDDLAWDEYEGEPGTYIWSEGNFSCDCNRALFHARALGREDPDETCGQAAYVMVSITVDGRQVYADAPRTDD